MPEKHSALIPLSERLDFGNLTVDETRALKNRSRAGFYDDLKNGRVSIVKIGRKSVVRGPVARAYINGEPLPQSSAA